MADVTPVVPAEAPVADTHSSDLSAVKSADAVSAASTDSVSDDGVRVGRVPVDESVPADTLLLRVSDSEIPHFPKAGDHGDGVGAAAEREVVVLNNRNDKDSKDVSTASLPTDKADIAVTESAPQSKEALAAEFALTAADDTTTKESSGMSSASVLDDTTTMKSALPVSDAVPGVAVPLVDTSLVVPPAAASTDLKSPASPGGPVTEKSVHDSVVAVGRGTGLDADSWVDVQQKTFIRWANYYLAKRNMKIHSVGADLTDGIALNNLLELLSHKTLRKWKVPAKSQIARLDNLAIAFDFMQSDGLKLVNVRSQDVENGNVKITLGLLWSLIQHYQIMKYAQPKVERRSSVDIKKTESPSAKSNTVTTSSAVTDAKTSTTAATSTAVAASAVPSAKADLLNWVNGKIVRMDVLPAKDFTLSFVSGHVLTALTRALVDEEKKTTSEDKVTIEVSSDPLTANSTAITTAESALQIPPLLDAEDIVHRPNEQSMMTYIACFRDRGHVAAAAVATTPIVAATSSAVSKATEPTPLVIDTDKTKSAESIDVVRSESDVPLGSEQSGHAPITPRPSDDEKVVSTTTLKVITTTDEPKGNSAELSPRAVPVNAPDHVDAVSTEKSNVQSVGVPGFTSASGAPSSSSSGVPKEVEVCMTNPDLKYVHATKKGSCETGELNSQWSTWTVIDTPTSDIIYFRDPYQRYLNCDDDGRVYMADQTDNAKWKVIRGQSQHFISHNGLYLTAQTAGGSVSAEKTESKYSALTLCFPVVEGYLKKKGRSGFKSWQERYFAFNGAIMSYWKNKAAVQANATPKGVYMPAKITEVALSKNDKNRFYLSIDGETIEFEAKNEFEAARWVKALNTNGIRSADEANRRWSVIKPHS